MQFCQKKCWPSASRSLLAASLGVLFMIRPTILNTIKQGVCGGEISKNAFLLLSHSALWQGPGRTGPRRKVAAPTTGVALDDL